MLLSSLGITMAQERRNGIEAPGFYLKPGYAVAATIDYEPPGLVRYYMVKKL